jgi:hypothetical protein
MQATSSIAISCESLGQSLDQPEDHRVGISEDDVENLLQTETRQSHHDGWLDFISRRLELTFPRATQRPRQFLVYVRGPRPAVDLPGSSSSESKRDAHPNFVSRRTISVDHHTDNSRAHVRPAARASSRASDSPSQSEPSRFSVLGSDLHHRSILPRSCAVLLDAGRIMDRLCGCLLEQERRMRARWDFMSSVHERVVRFPLPCSMFIG